MPSILIVDDEDAIRSLFRTFLEDEGYEVTTAGSAAEARNHLTRARFDVLLADLMLPEESGLSLLRFGTDLDDEMSYLHRSRSSQGGRLRLSIQTGQPTIPAGGCGSSL
jgi:two-component system phosphate regulon response regulator OmpR